MENTLKELNIDGKKFCFHSLQQLQLHDGFQGIKTLPFSIKILLEQALRRLDNYKVRKEDIKNLANWGKQELFEKEIPFLPARVILQDFTGVPSLVDLAALRSELHKNGKDPSVINPKIPVDLIVDHSVQVDSYGSHSSLKDNMDIEFERNFERYKFIKWGEKAFKNFSVYPPGAGIIHQVNLEYLANVIYQNEKTLFPDSLVGTDSHTTMINGIGVLGWGVGGIEAESAMLGQPIYMKIPEVIGFKLYGVLPPETVATDLVLRVTEILRNKGVVEKFVEFYGSGLTQLSVADRATIANMAPEYGATVGFFPVDERTLQYLLKTGRDETLVNKVEAYCKEQGLFREDTTPTPSFTDTVELDLSTVVPSIAGPKRPQDRIALTNVSQVWKECLTAPISKQGFNLSAAEVHTSSKNKYNLKHGSLVIAAITSCTNTSNPSVMLAAGLVAKKAVEKGLTKKEWVKTSLAPGSRVVTDYLDNSNLTQYLEKIGFYTVGYGCTTCIGNSGPLDKDVSDIVNNDNLIVAGVLSGNRNFEGRIHGEVKANFLASPPLVVVYSLAGRIDIDLLKEPLGVDKNGDAVFMKDIWPTPEEIQNYEGNIQPNMYRARYSNVKKISPKWEQMETTAEQVYSWNDDSTYIQNPPFFHNLKKETVPLCNIKNARVLLKLGDSVTTDHISPAGLFTETTPAGKYLLSKSIATKNFNSYGSRRGNDRIMTRGTFANIRIKNQLVPDTEGGFTNYFPENSVMTIFEASEKYKHARIPLIVLAGTEYGTGSSRDWAAKGSLLLGVSAVVVSSFERIHRSNLIGMGVLPLQFLEGETHESLQLKGTEVYSVIGLNDNIQPKAQLILKADDREIPVICRLDTPVEIEYYKNGGILHTVLRNFLKAA